MWRDIRRSDVYKNWPGGPFASLLNKPSIFDTTVMKEFFQKYFLKVPQRKVSVGTTNANTGEFVRFIYPISVDLMRRCSPQLMTSSQKCFAHQLCQVYSFIKIFMGLPL